MSSEFYSSSLSRNLVRTGGAGYRENASLRLLLGKAEETAERVDYYRGETTGFFGLSGFQPSDPHGAKPPLCRAYPPDQPGRGEKSTVWTTFPVTIRPLAAIGL